MKHLIGYNVEDRRKKRKKNWVKNRIRTGKETGDKSYG